MTESSNDLQEDWPGGAAWFGFDSIHRRLSRLIAADMDRVLSWRKNGWAEASAAHSKRVEHFAGGFGVETKLFVVWEALGLSALRRVPELPAIQTQRDYR